MGDQRLTRDELSWLLAQEARGAARALRDGVSQLTPRETQATQSAKAPAMQVTLDALDGAIDALTQLQARPRGSGLRGRIDVAALLFQLAPEARIVIDTGAGTEVYGDEAELSRMLHVMLSQSGNPGDGVETAPEIHVGRDGELIRLRVALGPDQSATAELERRWLNRMALRMGGRLELEGGDQALLLPADGASVQHEVDELRKELEQARQLGEAYARELAEVFAAGVAAVPPPTPNSDDASIVAGEARFDLLRSVGTALVRRLQPVLEGIDTDLEKARGKLGDGSALVQSLQHRHAALREVLGELNRAASIGPTDALSVDPVAVVQEVVAGAERRASRHAVRLALHIDPCSPIQTKRPILVLVLRSLLDHAIAATPREGEIQVRIGPVDPGGARIVVQDGGPSVPPRARNGLLHHRLDPASMGRPAGVTLLVAHTAATVLGARLSLDEGPRGGLAVCLALPEKSP